MKAETRKEEIILTAAKLFKEKGYSAVTMRDLASEMGIKAASLYNHIASKQQILTEIIISLAEEFTQEMNSIKNSDKSEIEKIKDIIALHVHITSNNQFGMASLNNDWMHLEEKLDYYLKLRTNYEEDFRDILQSGIDSNQLANGNAEVMLFSILSTLRSLYLWIPKKEDLDTTKLASDLSLVLVKGISK